MFDNYKNKIFIVLLLVTGSASQSLTALNIGLLVVATGKYTEFVAPLIESADAYFCKDHAVTYFVFTDGIIPQADNIIRIEQKRLGWPHDTMMRFAMYAQAKDCLQSMDYLYACDADMLFVDHVGDEILADLVGTLHPGFVGTKGTYETRSESTACMNAHEGKCYFAGGFTGGKTQSYLAMAQAITDNIMTDLSNNIIAVWHDESHLNRYFATHEPSLILSPSYCYWQGKKMPYPQKLVALVKNHEDYRS